MNKKGATKIGIFLSLLVALTAIVGLSTTVAGVPEPPNSCAKVESQCGGTVHPVSVNFPVLVIFGQDFRFSLHPTNDNLLCGERCNTQTQLDCGLQGQCPLGDEFEVNECIRCNPQTDPNCGDDRVCFDCGRDGLDGECDA